MNPQNLLSAPSVGSLVKKILAVNPELGVEEIIVIIRKATRIETGAGAGQVEGFGSTQIIDETFAIEFARTFDVKR